MKPYEILELSPKSDIQTVERRFMHLCSILQNSGDSMGNSLDKYNDYVKAYKKICEQRNVWENSSMLSNMKNNIFKNNTKLSRRGDDITLEMSFTIEDIFNQNMKKIQYMRKMETLTIKLENVIFVKVPVN